LSSNVLPETATPDSFFPNQWASKVAGMETPEQLSREAIDEFKAIYQEEFRKTLTDDEAKDIAMRLLRFFGILCDPGSDKTLDSPQPDR
jgi:hypothetical protein